MKCNRVAAAAGCALGLACGLPMITEAANGDVTLASVTVAGTQAAGDSNLRHGGGGVSADGRFVVFHSYRPNLVRNDRNGVADVFLRDVARGVTRRLSVAWDGGNADSYAVDASISADGRHVAFYSPASNLVQDDSNGSGDIFVWSRDTRALEIVSVNSNGRVGNDESLESAISADGRFVAFTSFASNLARNDTNDRSDVFLRDRQAGYTERVSVASDGREADGYSWQPSVSADGRYVAFYSTAANLVPDDRGDGADVFVRDRQTRQTRRASEAADGTPANGYSVQPVLSANGRYVAFVSDARNLVAGDTNGAIDVFVKDLVTGAVERVSVASGGAQADGASFEPALSADGRYVAFESFASNLVPGDRNRRSDVFVHDRETRTVYRVSVAADGAAANDHNWTPSFSADGRYIAFRSDATNLDAMDTNRSSDVYVKDLGPRATDGVSFTLRPAALDFGTRAVGTSTTQSFWLHNQASTYLGIDAMEIRDAGGAAYSVRHGCNTLVAPDGVCGIHITFHPTTAGPATAELTVRAAGGATRLRGLSGVAR